MGAAAVRDLTIEERIGQVLCFGWQGETPAECRTVNAHARALVAEMRAGSVVLLGRNVSSPDGMRETVDALQALADIPLFIAVDQEGGAVNRFRPPAAPFHEFPGAMALGAITEGPEDAPDRPERYAYLQARAQAEELRAVGVNWNFAPVADVNSNPANPIIGVRSFGEDPAHVSRYVAEAVRGYQEAGLLACAKHFPGHGDTSVDSHLSLPTVRGDRARLEAVELPPFRAAMAEGVGAVMTTHILFPALDPERPGTISPAILRGLLREELGYDGVVITDCLEMEAIAGTIGTPRGAVEALKAGADVALVCHTLETQRATVAAIRDAVQSGELPEERVNEAAGRVLAAKRRFVAGPRRTDRPWERESHHALEREIARKAVTVKKSCGIVPGSADRSGEAAVISAHHSLDRFGEALEKRGARVSRTAIPVDLPEWAVSDAVTEAMRVANRGGQVICVTSPPEPFVEVRIDQERQAQLVRALHRVAGARLIVVAAREPYDLRRFPTVATFMCGYGYRPCSVEAVADALTGAFEPSGRLPVTIPAER